MREPMYLTREFATAVRQENQKNLRKKEHHRKSPADGQEIGLSVTAEVRQIAIG